MASSTTAEKSRHPKPSGGQWVEYDEFIDRQIRKTRAQVKGVEIATALMLLAAGSLGFFLVAAVLDHWILPHGLGFWGRLLGLTIFLGGACYFAIQRLLPWLLYRINPVYAAQAIEKSRPTLKNTLINFLFLRGESARIPTAVYQAVEEQAAKGLSRVQVESAVDRTRLIHIGYALLAVVVLFAGYFLFSPKNPWDTVGRVMLPWADIQPPTRVEILDVQPGSRIVYRGQLVEVSAEIHGLKQDEPVQVVYSTADHESVDQPVTMYCPPDRFRYSAKIPLQSAAPGGGQAEAGVQQDIDYRVEAGDAISATYHLHAVTAPTIALESVEYQYPAYTGRSPLVLKSIGDIQSLEGTRITIHGRSNQAIKSADLELDGNSGRVKQPMQIGSDGRTITGSFTLALDEQDHSSPQYSHYRLRPEGRTEPEPVQYRIDVIPDQPPEVKFILPEKDDATLPVNRRLNLRLRASDPDFALSELNLSAEANRNPILHERLLNEIRREPMQVDYTIDPAKLNLKAGDVVEYWAEARDNREPQANSTETSKRRIRIVAADARQSAERQGDGSSDGQSDRSNNANPSDNPNGQKPQSDGTKQDSRNAEKKPGDNSQQNNPAQQQTDNSANPADQQNPQQTPQQNQQPNQPQQDRQRQPQQNGSRQQDKQSPDGSQQQNQPKNDQSAGGNSKQQPQQHNSQNGQNSQPNQNGENSNNKQSSANEKSQTQDSQSPNSPSNNPQNPNSESKNPQNQNPNEQSSNQRQPNQDAGKSNSKGGGLNRDVQSNKSNDNESGGNNPQSGSNSNSNNSNGPKSGNDSAGNQSPNNGAQPNGDRNPGSKSKGGANTQPQRQDQPAADGSDDTQAMKDVADYLNRNNKNGSQQSQPKNSAQEQPNGDNSKQADQSGNHSDKTNGQGHNSEGQKQPGEQSSTEKSASESPSGQPTENGEQRQSEKHNSANANGSKPNGNQPSTQEGDARSGADKQAGTAKSANEKNPSDSSSANSTKENANSSSESRNSKSGDNANQLDKDRTANNRQSAEGQNKSGSGNKDQQGNGDRTKDGSTPTGDKSDAHQTNEQSQMKGGDPDANKGKAGAGTDTAKNDKPTPPSPSDANKPTENKDQKPDGEGKKEIQPKDSGTASTASPKESNSKSDSQPDGTFSGGGGKNGGQQATQAGTGGAGSHSGAAQGNGVSDGKGQGDTSDKAGRDKLADHRTGESSHNEKGPGSESRPGQSQDANTANQESKPSPDGKNRPGSGQHGAAGQNSENPSSHGGAPNPQIGGGGTSDSNGPPPIAPRNTGDPANAAFAKKQFDMALNSLKKGNPDLLKELNWTPEQAQQLADRLERMRRNANLPGAKGEIARQQLDDIMQSLGDRSGRYDRGSGGNATDDQRGLRESHDAGPPPEYSEQVEAFKQGILQSGK